MRALGLKRVYNKELSKFHYMRWKFWLPSSWLLLCKLCLSEQEFVSCKLKTQMRNTLAARADMRVRLLPGLGPICSDGRMPAGKLAPSPSAELPAFQGSVCGCTVVRAGFPQRALPPNLHMGLFALEHTCWLSCVIKQMLWAWIKRGQSCTSISASVNIDHTKLPLKHGS